MEITLPAIYEHGVLRPLAPLPLPELSRVNVHIFNNESSGQEASYQRCLADIRRFLTAVQQGWESQQVQQVFAQRLEPDLRTLWRLAAPAAREVGAMLVLAAAQLQLDHLSPAQVSAFLFGIALLEQQKFSDLDIDACYEQLTLAGLPPSISLSESTIQSYLDEL